MKNTVLTEIKRSMGGMAFYLMEDVAEENNIGVGDWRNASYLMFIAGTDRKFTAKVSGFLKDSMEVGEAAAYMSFDTLARLLSANNVTVTINEVIIRCENIGYAKLIRNSLDIKILTTSAEDEELSVKSKLIRQNLIYLIIVAAICLNSALDLMRIKEKLGLSVDTHRLPVAFFANKLGLSTALLLPFFFPPEQRVDAIFALPVPVWALSIGIIIPFSICLFKGIRTGTLYFPFRI